MYQNYARRSRQAGGCLGHILRVAVLFAVLAGVVALCVAGIGVLLGASDSRGDRPVFEEGGVRRVSTVDGEHLAVYDGKSFEPRFWNGVNMGVTLPGHAPGELAPTRQDYLRWFEGMKEMNVDVVRAYTILDPEFYEALDDFNEDRREDPLWLVQGIWSPEEELIGEDGKGADAYSAHITGKFRQEIAHAVGAVHGDVFIEPEYGHASGRFRADVSQYVLGWMVGTEWYPFAVRTTNRANAGKEPFAGEFFRTTQDASPFEGWLASMLEELAQEEMRYGWQHPVALTNWLTTDPLKHPDEANPQEDMVSVDPMHIEPTLAWEAGYFASYHVYPYYPDFMRYEEKYQGYETEDGEKKDPYAGYLHDLRAHHDGVPLVVAEYGLPTSRGMAHEGPLGRDQGYHTEAEQGRMEAQMLERIREEGYDGGFLFAWHDEWFKFTWNTKDLNVPDQRRPLWPNRLTNEQNFGVIANEPGEEQTAIHLDGKTEDWRRKDGLLGKLLNLRPTEHDRGVVEGEYDGFNLSVAHDEGFLYLLAEKKDGDWNLEEDTLNVGFGTLPGGSEETEKVPSASFPSGGIQTLLRLGGEGDSRMYINSAYDYHTWLYGEKLDLIPKVPDGADPHVGKFLPWKLALNRPLVLPQSGRRIPFQEFDVGAMRTGVTDPRASEFNNLADWYAKGNVLEVRIPWMMLGFTDPSAHMVWDNLYETARLSHGFNDTARVSPTETDGLRVYPVLDEPGPEASEAVEPMSYGWEGWDVPDYHERKKQSYPILREAFEDEGLREPG